MTNKTDYIARAIEMRREYALEALAPQEIADFCAANRVEVILQDDCQLHCYINYDENKGSYAQEFDAYTALVFGIIRYRDSMASKAS